MATSPSVIYTLSLHDALPISPGRELPKSLCRPSVTHSIARMSSLRKTFWQWRSEEHTSELQSPDHLVCRLLLEKKKIVNEERARYSSDNIEIQLMKIELHMLS